VGDKGAGAGNTEKVDAAPKTPEGAVSGVDSSAVPAEEAPGSPESADQQTPEDAGGASREAASPPPQTQIELPEFEVHRLDRDDSIFDRAGAAGRAPMHPITGIWEQISGGSDPDFAPGGYTRSVLMLNPALKTAAVYRVFRGDITLVIGGELALDASEAGPRMQSGELTIRQDPSSTSKFRTTPLSLGGTPAITVVPPSGEGPWPLQWRRENIQLVVGGKRYAAISRDAFEKVRRGGGDIASEADLADRIEARPQGSSTQHVNETSFFGLRGGGKRICFVVDVSSSMAGTKLQTLKEELTGTIKSLKPGTMFSIVFFDDSAHTVAQAWMQSDADRARALQTIASQGPGSGTDPTAAFEFAFNNLSPLPDCIYYMTDGMTMTDVVGLLRRLNGGKPKTTVHAIAFGDQSLEILMKQIASENNGTYIFVP
jgi:hypothetical protein